MIAQAILQESDSGRSALAKSPNHNLFGIKGAFEGNSVPFNTLEADGNQLYSINATIAENIQAQKIAKRLL